MNRFPPNRRPTRIIAFLMAGLLTPAFSSAEAQRPNVLLICVDDLKPALGCYGDPLAKTPNIDRLAARGIRFEMAYCNQAVCAPSRNNLLLGSRSTSTGVYSLGLSFRLAGSKPEIVARLRAILATHAEAKTLVRTKPRKR